MFHYFVDSEVKRRHFDHKNSDSVAKCNATLKAQPLKMFPEIKSTKMVAIRIEISDYISRSKQLLGLFLLQKKPRKLIFKYIATILIESYEIKILISLSSPS